MICQRVAQRITAVAGMDSDAAIDDVGVPLTSVYSQVSLFNS